ncbi:MAG: OsmC family protein [Bacteroidetes bacterium]|nr:OsmC family protein [Bacteroidota bacterium]
MKRHATAVWSGSGTEGKGTLTGPSGVLDQTPYSFKARFENEDGKKGTNPEELIAAAHAGCYAMALSVGISNAGSTAEKLDVKANVKLEKTDDGFGITSIHLDLKGSVPGMDKATFEKLAKEAKAGCPVSKALSAVPISLDISYE